MKKSYAIVLGVFVSASLLACGGEDDTESMPGAAAGAGGEPGSGGGETSQSDGGEPAAAGAPTHASGPAELNGCKAGAFVDMSGKSAERTVQIAADGLVFTPPCLTVAAGQTVTFEGSLSAHPLAPGNPDDSEAGSPDSPIVATSSGSSVAFTFDVSGTFPYYCELHAFKDGRGMAGTIYVKP